MYKNIIKTALRHFVRYRGYTLTNIFGLAIGLATCILIFLYVQDELGYDRNFENAENIYRMEPHWTGQGEDSHWAATQGSTLPGIMKSYPEVESGVKFHHPYNPIIFRYDDQRFAEKNVLYADSAFLDVFNYDVISGDARHMLSGPGKIVLTRSTARRYFGDTEPVGKLLRVDDRSYAVSGIIQDPPRNSHLQFDLLISLDDMRSYWPGVDRDGPATFYSYVKFADQETARQVQKKYNDNIYTHLGMVVAGDSSNMPQEWTTEMIFRPITKIHLYGHAEKEISSNSDVSYVIMFAAVALFVLIIACFNYMNLATAKSTRRSREVGLRKVLGATRQHIFSQFMGESFAMVVLSMILALLLVDLSLPEFNRFTDKALSLDLLHNIPLMVLIVVIVIAVGFLSGTYPSVFMSRFSPIKSLKSNSLTASSTKTSLYLRRGLVLAQFTISIFLIIGILTVNKQLRYIQNKNLGFDKEQVLVLHLPDRSAKNKIEVMKNELLQNSGISSVAAASDVPGERIPFFTVRVPGNNSERHEQTEENADDSFTMRTWSVGYDFVKTLGLELVDGRAFSKDYGTDEQNAFIVNEAAVRELNLKPAVGHDFEYLYNMPEPKRGKIIGVVRDFHFASLHHEVEPVVIHIFPHYVRYLLVKLNTSQIQKTMADIEAVWNDHIPYLPIDSFFLDASYDNLYRKEMNTGTILGIFTILAIIIAVLGLFGLASYITEQRTKEIGIRKVLGASIPGIISNLSREFVILIAMANLLAWIPAFLFLNDWLDTFRFRTSISIWIFVISALISLLIAVFTVSAKAYSSARANPVKSLRAD